MWRHLIAGASAVQIGTATYVDPSLPERLVEELEVWCRENGVKKVGELTGSLDTKTKEEGGTGG